MILRAIQKQNAPFMIEVMDGFTLTLSKARTITYFNPWQYVGFCVYKVAPPLCDDRICLCCIRNYIILSSIKDNVNLYDLLDSILPHPLNRDKDNVSWPSFFFPSGTPGESGAIKLPCKFMP